MAAAVEGDHQPVLPDRHRRGGLDELVGASAGSTEAPDRVLDASVSSDRSAATGKKSDSLDGTTRRANYSLVEALVLAKAIVLGNALGIWDHFRNRPLSSRPFTKGSVSAFSCWVLGPGKPDCRLVVREESGAARQSILGEGLAELLTRVLVVILAPAPLFAV